MELASDHLCSARTHKVYSSSLGAQSVKNLPAVPETWVPSLGWEDLLEEDMAAPSSLDNPHEQRRLAGYRPWVWKSRTWWATQHSRAQHSKMNPLSSWVTQSTMGFPGGSSGKESACNAGDLGSIPMLGRSCGEGNGYALQYSGLENSMICMVCGVAKSRTQLSDFHFPFFVFDIKLMSPKSCILFFGDKYLPVKHQLTL